MSEEEADWEKEDFDSQAAEGKQTDKWAGEDEDDDVKDNWDDEDGAESKSGEENDTEKAYQVKKKKSLAEKIAERENKRKAALEEKRRKEEEAKQLTPEEEAAEKLRRQKLQEDSDLELAKEAFGVTDDTSSKSGIDAMSPETKEDFNTFSNALRDKIMEYEKSEHYVGFLEGLFRDLAINLEADDMKKLGSTLNSLGIEKAKVQKAAKGKKTKKKATLNTGKGSGLTEDLGNGDDYGLYDDFM